ncbi:MAG: hypothetical protein OXI88_05970 [Gammaproteobacteria bacterium]|nr:hypothetical protein [Gammaproteobacteria bacterium]MDE0285385.1 hypothetical protein [Gammaproteobacteria bacterium]MDE0511313.1 hypothetical protein [Gammaproteobacteria bacterium]
MTTLTIDLPDNLVEEAGKAGLLAPDALEVLLREALRRLAVDDLFKVSNRLVAADFPPMTPGEIQQEVDAVRARRKQRARGA